MVSQDSTKHQPMRVDAAKELGEADPYWWFVRANSLVIKWRRECAPDEGDVHSEKESRKLSTMATDRIRTVAIIGVRNMPQRILTTISNQSSDM